MSVVLDTCGLIWWSLDPKKLSEQARETCKQMEKENSGLISSISLWEIALKIKKKKLDLGIDLNSYLAALRKSKASALKSGFREDEEQCC